MSLDEDGHGPMTRKVKGGLWETIGSMRWATGVKLGESVVNVVECHQEKPAEEAYYGQFATDLEVGKAVYAQKVAEWGRRRWTEARQGLPEGNAVNMGEKAMRGTAQHRLQRLRAGDGVPQQGIRAGIPD